MLKADDVYYICTIEYITVMLKADDVYYKWHIEWITYRACTECFRKKPIKRASVTEPEILKPFGLYHKND